MLSSVCISRVRRPLLNTAGPCQPENYGRIVASALDLRSHHFHHIPQSASPQLHQRALVTFDTQKWILSEPPSMTMLPGSRPEPRGCCGAQIHASLPPWKVLPIHI